MKLLLIEDEQKTAAYLQQGLTEHGFGVTVADNGEEGLFEAQQQEYDLIILDVMLPKRDGWSVIKLLRQHSTQVRILFLTACDQIEDKVKGLELGADDYLVKPFAFSELLARIRTLLRRSTQVPVTQLQIADLVIDLTKHKAFRGAKHIDLTAKEFMLLVFLVQHQQQVLSRTFIAERVWDIHFDCDSNVIDVAVRRLRQKIDDHFSNKLIHTVRGIGYVLEERLSPVV